LKLYFDTTTWVRLYEEGDSKIIAERDATTKIITCKNDLEIITSQFQLRQMYSKVNSHSIDPNKREAFRKAVATCEVITTSTPKFDPYCEHHLKDFSSRVTLRHNEDKHHIILAWMKEADFFITTDDELYNTQRIDIENTLNNMIHPSSAINYHKVRILNPIEFCRIFKK
jgi:predicted nucleic acid-binding protein